MPRSKYQRLECDSVLGLKTPGFFKNERHYFELCQHPKISFRKRKVQLYWFCIHPRNVSVLTQEDMERAFYTLNICAPIRD